MANFGKYTRRKFESLLEYDIMLAREGCEHPERASESYCDAYFSDFDGVGSMRYWFGSGDDNRDNFASVISARIDERLRRGRCRRRTKRSFSIPSRSFARIISVRIICIAMPYTSMRTDRMRRSTQCRLLTVAWIINIGITACGIKNSMDACSRTWIRRWGTI